MEVQIDQALVEVAETVHHQHLVQVETVVLVIQEEEVLQDLEETLDQEERVHKVLLDHLEDHLEDQQLDQVLQDQDHHILDHLLHQEVVDSQEEVVLQEVVVVSQEAEVQEVAVDHAEVEEEDKSLV